MRLRFLTVTISAALISAALTWFLPWWTLVPVCFLAGIFLSPGRAFLSGFLAIALLWGIAGWYISAANEHLLLGRLAQLFQLPRAWMYLALSAVIGGLCGGMGAWTGSLLLGLSRKPRFSR